MAYDFQKGKKPAPSGPSQDQLNADAAAQQNAVLAASPNPTDPTAGLAQGALDPQAIAFYQALQRQQNVQDAPALGFQGMGIDLTDHGLISQLPPEIQSIFGQAANDAAAGSPWTQEKFQSKLVGTNWWRTNADSTRQYLWQKVIDPATAIQSGNQATFKVLQAASAMGRPITMAQAAQIGESFILNGWDDAMLQQHLATDPLGRGQSFGPGQLRTNMAQVKGIGADYGLNISDLSAAGWAQKITAGSMDTKAFEDYARQQAAITHPYWQKQLNEGITLRQLADPYIQTAAQTLGISADAIDLSDPKWGTALQAKDKTGAVTGPMSQLDWQRKLMTDPGYGWDKTQNAMTAAFNMRDKLMSTFGFNGA